MHSPIFLLFDLPLDVIMSGPFNHIETLIMNVYSQF
jgi:hypothetical protein